MGLRFCVSEKHSGEANGAGPWSGEGLTRGKHRTVGLRRAWAWSWDGHVAFLKQFPSVD